MKVTHITNNHFQDGIDNFQTQMEQMKDIYNELINLAALSSHSDKVLRVTDNDMLNRALRLFGPQIEAAQHQLPLQNLYEVAIHHKSGAIVVASQVSTLSSKTILMAKTFDVQFQVIAVYMPGLGIEIAHVGRVGEVHHKPYVLRSESSCTPSFLFGSQECNCASQWRCTQELAAHFNTIDDVEETNIGFLMIHLESQNGMGMGYTPDTFAIDLGMRASLRHAAGLAASQAKALSIQETFQCFGMPQDPRRSSEGAGYKITPIILDFIGAHAEPILLSNNPMKIAGLEKFGYAPLRLKLLGEITSKGESEAKQRAQDFGHLDIDSTETSFVAEFNRLQKQIRTTYQTWRHEC